MKYLNLILIIIIYSCNTDNRVYQINEFLKDSIVFQKNLISIASPGHFSYNATKKDKIIYYFNAIDKKAVIISQKDSAKRLLKLEKFLIEKKIFSTRIINDDSVFSIKDSIPQIIYLTDINGEVKNEWNLNNLKDKYGNSIEISGIVLTPIMFHDSTFYMFHIYKIYNEETFKKYSDHDFLVTLQLHKDSISLINTFGNIPYKHRDVNLGTVFGNCNAALLNQNILISYNNSDEIYIYNKGKLLDSFYMGGINFKKIKENFNDENSGNKDIMIEFASKHHMYLKIYANKNFIIRTMVNPYKQLDEDGNLTPPSHGSWNLIVADAYFKKIKEIHIKNKHLDISSIMQTEHGVYIRSIKNPHIFYYYEIFP